MSCRILGHCYVQWQTKAKSGNDANILAVVVGFNDEQKLSLVITPDYLAAGTRE